MLQSILGYLFLFIFGITALLSILSLPNWISIPEWYRKKLFIALILEVVGAIIILFNQSYLDQSDNYVTHTISEDHCLVLNESGQVVHPLIHISTSDTAYDLSIGRRSFDVLPNFNSTASNEGLIIKTTDGTELGKVSAEILRQTGFFNAIKTAKGEVSSSHNYTLVKWRKNTQTNGEWIKYGSYIEDSPFHLIVFDENQQTKYHIVDLKTDEIIFSSDSNAKQLFDVDNRIIHFFEKDGHFYLLRIVEAHLQTPTEQYTHVLQIRLEPSIQL